MAISAIGGLNLYINFSSANSSSEELSSETRSKLTELGLNYLNYKTEDEAQVAIVNAENAKKTQEAEETKQTDATDKKTEAIPVKKETASETQIMTNTKLLAKDVGLVFSNNETINVMFRKISDRINQLVDFAQDDYMEMEQVRTYKERLAWLSAEYGRTSFSLNQIND